jgi:hypothetical protein
LKKVLKKLCITYEKDLDEMLPYALFAYRETPYEETGFSPLELLYNGPFHVAVILEISVGKNTTTLSPVEKWHFLVFLSYQAFILCITYEKDLDEMLPYALFAYRETPHEETGFSPLELLYG